MDEMDRAGGVDVRRSPRLLWVALPAIAALCAACGGDREPVAAREPPAQAAPVKAVAEAPPPEPRPAAISGEKIASYRSLLRDGRTKVRAKEYGAGIALYERALALRPGDPRLLVELGWAAFLEGNLERAAQATQRGLAGVRDDGARGAALYNLGRIAEQRGDRAGAARQYRESLAVRPNTIVEKRLNGLGVETAAAGTAVAERSELGPLEGPLPSVQAVCDVLLAENAMEGSEVGCEQGAAQVLEIGDGPLKRALLLPLWRGYGGGGFEIAAEVMRYLVVETTDGFYRTRGWVAYVYSPGAFGIYEELSSQLSLRELVPGGQPEIVMKATHQRTDSDLGILEAESEETEWLLVCGLVDGAPRCLDTIPLRYAYERAVMDIGEVGPAFPVEHTPGLPIRGSYRFSVEFDGEGGYTLTEAEPPVGDAAGAAGVRAGAFRLR